MTANWQLMASHGTILVYLVNRPDATIREIANATDLTERRVSQVLRDLSDSDVISVERRGRRNVYEINQDCTLNGPGSEIRVESLVNLVKDTEGLRQQN
jgi:DNA-binding transcriptional regulator GbsR (MarR family)